MRKRRRAYRGLMSTIQCNICGDGYDADERARRIFEKAQRRIDRAYEKGRVDAYEDAEKRLRYLWQQYEADKEHVPKPQFTEAIALITLLELDAEEKS